MVRQENTGLSLIEAVDEETRQAFFRMLQKFTGLKAEIAAKRLMLEEFSSPGSKEKQADLELLGTQVDEALASIDELFYTSIPEEVTKDAFIKMTSAELKAFREEIGTQLHQLAELSEKI